jgi:anti-sigma factor RsiW
MGGFISAPSAPAAPAPPPLPEPVDTDKEAREARIKALIRRRRGRAGLTVAGNTGALTASVNGDSLGTRLGS